MIHRIFLKIQLFFHRSCLLFPLSISSPGSSPLPPPCCSGGNWEDPTEAVGSGLWEPLQTPAQTQPRSTEAQGPRYKTECMSQHGCQLKTTFRLGRFIGLCCPWVCFEQTTDWEDQKEGGREAAVNQRGLSNSPGQKAGPAERTRKTASPWGRPGVTSCASQSGALRKPVTALIPSFSLALNQLLLEGKSSDFMRAPQPPFSLNTRRTFSQVIVSLLLVILFLSFSKCAISSPDPHFNKLKSWSPTSINREHLFGCCNHCQLSLKNRPACQPLLPVLRAQPWEEPVQSRDPMLSWKEVIPASSGV